MRFFFRGIGWRIFLSFSLLFVFLGLVLTYVAVKYVERSATDNAANELRVISVSISQQVERTFKRIEANFKSLAAPSGFLENELSREKVSRKNLANFIFNKTNLYPAFEMLAVFDKRGTCLESTDRDWVGLSGNREPFFFNGIKRFSYAEVFENPEYEGKILLISAPIGEPNNPQGVLVARLRLSTIYDLMDQKLALRGNAEAFLLDSKLRFITPLKNSPDELSQSHLSVTPLVSHLDDEFWVGRYDNSNGVQVLGTVLKMPAYKWYLVIERDFAEVEGQLDAFRRTVIQAALVLLFILIVTTVVLTTSITRPLQNLVLSAQKIASGNLHEPVQVPIGPEEISFLSAEFDKMRARVAASQGRLQEKLEESEQRRIESERLAAIGTLASSLAHEIRNPLNAMNLLISQMKLQKLEDSHRLQVLDRMTSEISRLDQLVNEILDYARPLQLTKVKVDISDLIFELLLFYENLFEQKNVKVEFASYHLVVNIDPSRMKQAFMNIIQNAVEAMPTGGSLIVELKKEADEICITFKDSGIGISEAARRRLFDLFFTTKERGTGIGLSTVRKIIDGHGGHIEISSAPGQGTSFYLFLPFAI